MGAEHLGWIIAAALLLDLALGDPPRWPHPVRWMGAAVVCLETRLRGGRLGDRNAGRLLVLILVPGVWALSAALVLLAGWCHPLLGLLVQAVMLWTCVAARGLYSAAMAVAAPLERGDLEAARKAVGLIVGRETESLDASGVARAAVETVAENMVDGILAPLFFVLLGGAPLAMAYRMVNTLDSMVGYRSARYIHFGRAAARLDDAANYLPARLSVALIAAGAHLCGGRGPQAWRIARRDGRRHASPNAGFPEAAFAGALAVRLGGPNRYHGQVVEKPFIGSEFPDATVADIPRACRLMRATTLLAAALGMAWSLL
jgi:adenosylcobinamide-phosphate synthase